MLDGRSGLLRTVEDWELEEGSPSPLGATWVDMLKGYNFALYSRHATGVTLLIYREDDVFNPRYELRFDYLRHKTERVWHCWVPGEAIPDAHYYAYRVDGPNDTMAGHRFDRSKILLDPFATEVFFPEGYDRESACTPGLHTDGRAPLGVLPARIPDSPLPPFDWDHDMRPRHTYQAIVYELHVRGFTARPQLGRGPDRRGTFAGLIEKIPYLKELGVTVVELMPVHQFDPQEGNYWGYMTLNFFAPAPRLRRGRAGPTSSAQMVKALHEAGHRGLAGRGLQPHQRGRPDRADLLLPRDRQPQLLPARARPALLHQRHRLRQHAALRTSRPRAASSWTACGTGPSSMHVDGFRFDLASILTRNDDGSVNTRRPAGDRGDQHRWPATATSSWWPRPGTSAPTSWAAASRA